MAEGILEVCIRDEGRPTGARVHIRDSEGRWRYAPGHLPYERDRHFTVHGGFTIGLPPGDTHILIEKGKEYRRITDDVCIQHDEKVTREYDLQRWISMNELGWFSGDTHVHRSPAVMPHLMDVEDLNVAPVLNFWNQRGGLRQIYDWQDYSDDRVVRVGNRAFGLVSQEDERMGGAIMALNLEEPVRIEASDWYPSEARYAKVWREKGAVVEQEKPFWWEAPVNVASGLVDTMGIVNNHLQRTEVMDNEAWGRPRDGKRYPGAGGFVRNVIDLYYRYLNLGIKLPISAGSASGVLRNPLGYNRLYVRMDEFSYEGWFKGMKGGTAFATNGPMLFFTIDGELPGLTVKRPSPGCFEVDLDARSQDELDRLELICNGQVLLSYDCRGATDFATHISYEASTSAWLAARVFEKCGQAIRFAHTNPAFLEVPDPLSPKREDAEYYIDWMKELLAASRNDPDRYGSPVERLEVEKEYSSALDFYENLLGDAG